MRICEQMIILKEGEGDPQDDLEFWKWALSVIRRYGADGMSSEESEDDFSGQRYERKYRVKVMVWRRRVDDLLKIIDDSRRGDNLIFSRRGFTGVTRNRPEYGDSDWPRSGRDAVAELPYVFYDEDWFSEIAPDIRQAMLYVTDEEFKWLRVFT